MIQIQKGVLRQLDVFYEQKTSQIRPKTPIIRIKQLKETIGTQDTELKTSSGYKYNKNQQITREKQKTQSNKQRIPTPYKYNGKLSIKNAKQFLSYKIPPFSFRCVTILNLDYSDLAKNVEGKTNNYLAKTIQCISNYGTPGCQCQNKCPWIDKWNSLIKEDLQNWYEINCMIKNEPKINNVVQIQKDINRTQPSCSTFKRSEYLQRLRQVLILYSIKDEEVGYVQGMNTIASIIIYHARDSCQSLRIFETMMVENNLREIYINNLVGATKHTKNIVNILKYKCNNLSNYLNKNNVDIQIFIIGWLFALMGNFIPLQSMHLVIDAFMVKGWSGIYKIIITLLIYLKDQILQKKDATQIMEVISIRNLANKTVDWEELISVSNKIKINIPLNSLNQIQNV